MDDDKIAFDSEDFQDDAFQTTGDSESQTDSERPIYSRKRRNKKR
jgi:hypothetical protein